MIRRGTQIAYIPLHANGDIDHPDVEFGFVTSVVQIGYKEDDIAFYCRFWRKGEPGVLRTVANSERCYEYQIVEHTLVEQSVVDETLKKIYQDEKRMNYLRNSQQ